MRTTLEYSAWSTSQHADDWWYWPRVMRYAMRTIDLRRDGRASHMRYSMPDLSTYVEHVSRTINRSCRPNDSKGGGEPIAPWSLFVLCVVSLCSWKALSSLWNEEAIAPRHSRTWGAAANVSTQWLYEFGVVLRIRVVSWLASYCCSQREPNVVERAISAMEWRTGKRLFLT